ncbi:MAG: hypothetical protein ACK5MI_00800 [Mangrovibacterium sp.]
MTEKNKKVRKLMVSKTKLVWVLTILLLGAILISISYFTKYKTSDEKLESIQQEYDNLQEEQFRQDSIMNAMEDVFDEIQYNLNFVQERRGQLFLESQEGNKDPRKQIVDDVKLMDRILYESEAKIKELQEELEKEGIAIPAYERRLKALQKTIKQQNSDIIDLQQVVAVQDFKLSDLQQKVDTMNERISLQKDSIALQVDLIKSTDKKLHVGYVAYGTAKELKAKHLISKEGAVLGMGGSDKLPGDFDQSYFMEVDMRDVAQISIHAKKAELVTQHPEKSYHFETKDGEVKFLSIDDPKEFWKLSHFVVIKVK